MVGKERIEETIDPEQAIDRALDTYLKKGYSEEWIHQRLLAIRIRNELTDEWKKRGVQKGKEYAILTDEISRAWSGMTTGQYKRLKGLTKENLRDNMTDLELVLTMLAEASTTDISKTAKPQTFEENKQVAKRGGKVAGIARQALEAETGKPVITEKNAFDFQQLVTDIVEDAAELPENPTEKKQKPAKEKKAAKQKKKVSKERKVKRPIRTQEPKPACLNPVADYLPISKIENGIIYTKDHRYVKVVEVVPINFMLRSAQEQRNIIYSFVSYLKISPIKLQIKVLTHLDKPLKSYDFLRSVLP